MFFILVHERKVGKENRPVMINPEKVEKIEDNGKFGATIYFQEHCTHTVESYKDVVDMLKRGAIDERKN